MKIRSLRMPLRCTLLCLQRLHLSLVKGSGRFTVGQNLVCLVSDWYLRSGKIKQKPPEQSLVIAGKTKGKLAKEGSEEKIGMECTYISQSEIWREEFRSLVPCSFSGALWSFSVGSFQMSPSLPFGFPRQSPVALLQAVPLVTFHGSHVVSQPCPVPLKLCVPWSQPFLLAELAMAVRGTACGRGAEELGLCLVSFQLQNLTQTHWCTQGRENWQCRAVWNMAPAFSGSCFVFSEHPTLCRRCDKSLWISEEGQDHRLKQEWPLWFKSSLIWRIKRCKSLFMLWGPEN